MGFTSDLPPDDLAEVEVISTADEHWAEFAVDGLADGANLLIVDDATGRRCLITYAEFDKARPMWSSIYAALIAAGIRAPRWPR